MTATLGGVIELRELQVRGRNAPAMLNTSRSTAQVKWVNQARVVYHDPRQVATLGRRLFVFGALQFGENPC